MNRLLWNYKNPCSAALVFALLLLSAFSTDAPAGGITRWLTQTVYVPLYSHIYADERYRDKPFNLTATLSIRNIDPENGLTLKNVDYFDSEGRLLKKYLDKPVTIAPLASTRFIVKESESEGGSGAKFIVTWTAPKPIAEPIIESVMIGTKLQQGISFLSRGRVIAGDSVE